MNDPEMSPMLRSPSFWGKTVTQLLLVVNGIMKSYGKAPINIEPELTATLAIVLEGLYLSLRAHNKSVMNRAKAEIQVSRDSVKVEEAKASVVVAQTKAREPVKRKSKRKKSS